MASAIVISDSEPERAEYNRQRLARKQARKRRVQEQTTSSNDEVQPVKRQASASRSHSRSHSAASSSSSAAATSSTRASSLNARSGIDFQSASSLLQAEKRASASPVSASGEGSTTSLTFAVPVASDFEEEDDDVIEVVRPAVAPLPFVPSTNAGALGDAHLSSQDGSPGAEFRRTMASRFLYKPNRPSAATIESAALEAASAMSRRNLFQKAADSIAREAALTELSDLEAATDKGKGKATNMPPEVRPKSKKRRSKDTLEHVHLLPVELVAILEQCPICERAWTASKSGTQKHEHITSCAKREAWDLKTVRKIVERTVLVLRDKASDEQQRTKASRTIFDNLIASRARGKSVEVDVVGTDPGAIAASQGGSLHEHASTTQVSRELQQDKVKARKAQAGPSKATRLGKALAVLEQHSAILGDYKTEGLAAAAEVSGKSSPIRRPTGQLKVYSETMHAISNRVNQALDAAAEQAHQKEPNNADRAGDLHCKEDDDNPLPPSTQPLAPSKLAAIPKQKAPLQETSNLSARFGICRSETTASLWALAASTDDVKLNSRLEANVSSPPSSPLVPLSTHATCLPPLEMSSVAKENKLLSQRWMSTKADAKFSQKTAQSKNAKTSDLAARPAATPSDKAQDAIAIPPPPDYSDWSLEELQKETGKYGYKPSGTKKACIATLNRIWAALQKYANEKPKTKAKKKQPEKSVQSLRSLESIEVDDDSWSSDQSLASSASSARRVGSGRKSRVSNVSLASAGEFLSESEADQHGSDELDSEDDRSPAGFQSTMRRLVMNNDDLYSKILMYQPVPFEAFVTIAKDHNLKASAITIRQFLDKMCITFYMDQKTGRNRQRTKKKTASPKKIRAKSVTPKKKVVAARRKKVS